MHARRCSDQLGASAYIRSTRSLNLLSSDSHLSVHTSPLWLTCESAHRSHHCKIDLGHRNLLHFEGPSRADGIRKIGGKWSSARVMTSHLHQSVFSDAGDSSAPVMRDEKRRWRVSSTTINLVHPHRRRHPPTHPCFFQSAHHHHYWLVWFH